MRAMSLNLAALGAAALLLAACRPSEQEPSSAGAHPSAVPPATAPGSRPAADREFDAVGTEPFWNIQARPGSLLLQRAGAAPVSTASPGPAPGEGGAIVWSADALRLELRPGDCSDGMSDRVFPYSATATLAGGEVLKGCAAPPSYFDGFPRP